MAFGGNNATASNNQSMSGIPTPSSLGQNLMAQGLLGQPTPQNPQYFSGNSSQPMQMTMMGYKPLAFVQTKARVTPTTFQNFAKGSLPTSSNTPPTYNFSSFP